MHSACRCSMLQATQATQLDISHIGQNKHRRNKERPTHGQHEPGNGCGGHSTQCLTKCNASASKQKRFKSNASRRPCGEKKKTECTEMRKNPGHIPFAHAGHISLLKLILSRTHSFFRTHSDTSGHISDTFQSLRFPASMFSLSFISSSWLSACWIQDASG